MSEPEWTPFVPGTLPPDYPAGDGETVWLNSRYQVNMRPLVSEDPAAPKMVWLSIKRLDREAIHDWRELQRIKNEMLGPEVEAVELYPAESRLVDTANQYHLWAFIGWRLPIGFDERLVAEGSHDKSKQRPFEVRPPDLMSEEELNEKIANWKGKRGVHGV